MMRFGRFFQVAALIMLAAGAQPAVAAFWQWSRTAATNATADPTINWSEGMSPSSVNDSARAMMARAAEYRDDISGSVTTGGTSTAYTVTSNQGLNAIPVDGQMLAFRASATNGVAATMTVDGGTTYPLQSPAGTALPAGTLIAGTPYRMQFNLASTAWVIEGITGNPYAVSLGSFMISTAPSPPNSNFILPAGQCISTTTYATYWVQQGSPASGACAGGQFAVVDIRSRLPLPLDNLNGTAANRYTSSGTGCGTAMTSVGAVCANASEASTISTPNLPPYTPAGNNSITITFGTNGNPLAVFNGGGSAGFTGTGANASGPLLGGPGGIAINSGFAGTPAPGQISTPMSRAPHVIGLMYFLRVI